MSNNMSKPGDPATRMQAITAGITAKLAAKQQQAQAPTAEHDPQVVSMFNEQIHAARADGNPSLSIALKGALKQYLSAPYPFNLKSGYTPS
jgi:hypothetical protein